MPVSHRTDRCPWCQEHVLVALRSPDHRRHLIASLCTLGLWLPAWIVIARRPAAWRCTVCDQPVGESGTAGAPARTAGCIAIALLPIAMMVVGVIASRQSTETQAIDPTPTEAPTLPTPTIVELTGADGTTIVLADEVDVVPREKEERSAAGVTTLRVTVGLEVTPKELATFLYTELDRRHARGRVVKIYAYWPLEFRSFGETQRVEIGSAHGTFDGGRWLMISRVLRAVDADELTLADLQTRLKHLGHGRVAAGQPPRGTMSEVDYGAQCAELLGYPNGAAFWRAHQEMEKLMTPVRFTLP